MSPDRYGERDSEVMRACPKHRPPQPGTGLDHLAPKSEDREDRNA